jgi:hypothetical protein
MPADAGTSHLASSEACWRKPTDSQQYHCMYSMKECSIRSIPVDGLRVVCQWQCLAEPLVLQVCHQLLLLLLPAGMLALLALHPLRHAGEACWRKPTESQQSHVQSKGVFNP